MKRILLFLVFEVISDFMVFSQIPSEIQDVSELKKDNIITVYIDCMQMAWAAITHGDCRFMRNTWSNLGNIVFHFSLVSVRFKCPQKMT